MLKTRFPFGWLSKEIGDHNDQRSLSDRFRYFMQNPWQLGLTLGPGLLQRIQYNLKMSRRSTWRYALNE
jgi:hypothetical protein